MLLGEQVLKVAHMQTQGRRNSILSLVRKGLSHNVESYNLQLQRIKKSYLVAIFLQDSCIFQFTGKIKLTLAKGCSANYANATNKS